MEEKQGKKWYESKTIFFASMQIAIGILLAISDYVVEGGALTVIGIITAILRYLTTVPLSVK